MGNVGLVLGDGYIDIEDDHKDLRNLIEHRLPVTKTWQSPARSLHRLFECSLAHTIKLNAGTTHLGDIQSTGSMVLVPGCTHPNGGHYRIANESPIARISEMELFDVIRPFVQKEKEHGRLAIHAASTRTVDLNAQQRTTVVRLLAPFWKKGQRHLLTIYLCGYLLKRRVRYMDAREIVTTLCDETGDEEKKARLANVSYHYRNRVTLLPRLKGYSGLREIIEGGALEQDAD